jgi:hypothetical protein
MLSYILNSLGFLYTILIDNVIRSTKVGFITACYFLLNSQKNKEGIAWPQIISLLEPEFNFHIPLNWLSGLLFLSFIMNYTKMLVEDKSEKHIAIKLTLSLLKTCDKL